MQFSLYLSKQSEQDRKIIAFLRSFRKRDRSRQFKKWLLQHIEDSGSALPMEAEPEPDQLQPEFKPAPFALHQLGAVIRALHKIPQPLTTTAPTPPSTPTSSDIAGPPSTHTMSSKE